MLAIPQSTAYLVMFKAFLASDHVTEATGKTIVITISKNGGAFGNPAAGATNATEISSGWYKVSLGTGDTDTLGPLAIRGAVATIDDVGQWVQVCAATNGGWTALPAVAASAIGGLLTAPTTANVGLADLSRILGTALTETAGLLAGGFKKLFNVSSPTGTLNSIPDVVAGAAGGLFIAGTNAATTVTTALTTTFTGNLTGSVGSVTGAVGSVTGAVGSVTGAVGSVGAGGITAASLASDTITAAKIADGAIDAATFAAGAINAAAIASDAITAAKIADGAIDAATFAAGAIDAAAIATDAFGALELAAGAAAEIATAVWQDSTAGDFTVASSIGKSLYTGNVVPGGTNGLFIAGTNAATAITTGLTSNIIGNITGNLSGSVGSVTGAVGSVTGAVGSVTGNVGGNVAGAVGSVTGNVGGNVTGSVGSLATQAKADVNAEVVDTLNVDTYAEIGQETPAATQTIRKMLGYLYKAWRNKSTQTASAYNLFNDDAATVDQKATTSDNAVTFTKGEVAGGP